MEKRIALTVHCLKPRRAVDVGDARQPLAPFWPDRACREHVIENRGRRELEVVMRSLQGRRWSKGSKALPQLDDAVQSVFDVWYQGVRQNRSIAERARAEFHA